MLVSYSLVSTAVVMFAFQLYLSSAYEKQGNTNSKAAFKFSCGAFMTGFVILFIINRFRFEFTPFSAGISFLAALNSIAFSFCSLKSFSKINLSLYSVFCSLGGMVLPFIVGLVFYDEKLTAGKIICLVLIAAALGITVEKGNKSGGTIYYIGVFVFNGLSGVLSKIHNDAPFEKTSEAGYSMLLALWTVIICIILILLNKDENIKLTKKSTGCIIGYGILSNVANYFLLLSLRKGLPASAQYPFVTGGLMIVSTIICCFTPDKPKKKEVAAVVLSFIGIMALCFLDR